MLTEQRLITKWIKHVAVQVASAHLSGWNVTINSLLKVLIKSLLFNQSWTFLPMFFRANFRDNSMTNISIIWSTDVQKAVSKVWYCTASARSILFCVLPVAGGPLDLDELQPAVFAYQVGWVLSWWQSTKSTWYGYWKASIHDLEYQGPSPYVLILFGEAKFIARILRTLFQGNAGEAQNIFGANRRVRVTALYLGKS